MLRRLPEGWWTQLRVAVQTSEVSKTSEVCRGFGPLALKNKAARTGRLVLEGKWNAPGNNAE